MRRARWVLATLVVGNVALVAFAGDAGGLALALGGEAAGFLTALLAAPLLFASRENRPGRRIAALVIALVLAQVVVRAAATTTWEPAIMGAALGLILGVLVRTPNLRP